MKTKLKEYISARQWLKFLKNNTKEDVLLNLETLKIKQLEKDREKLLREKRELEKDKKRITKLLQP